MHLTVGEQDGSSITLRRHIGERRLQRLKRPRAVLTGSDAGAHFDDPHLGIGQFIEFGTQMLLGGIRARAALTQFLTV